MYTCFDQLNAQRHMRSVRSRQDCTSDLDLSRVSSGDESVDTGVQLDLRVREELMHAGDALRWPVKRAHVDLGRQSSSSGCGVDDASEVDERFIEAVLSVSTADQSCSTNHADGSCLSSHGCCRKESNVEGPASRKTSRAERMSGSTRDDEEECFAREQVP